MAIALHFIIHLSASNVLRRHAGKLFTWPVAGPIARLLNSHADPANLHVENPDLVRLDDGRMIALWEQWTSATPTGLWAMMIDEWGNVLEAPRMIGDARLYRGDDAISLGDRAAWVVGDANVPQLVLHTVDDALQLQTFELP